MRMRAFDRCRDVRPMLELALAAPDANLHTIDLPYRLCSWALDDPGNVALWEDGHRLVGWAALQTPFWAVDFAFPPKLEPELFPAVLAWADKRAVGAKETFYGHASWYVSVFADQEKRLRRLEAAGYANQSDAGEGSWSRVLLRRLAPASDSVPLSGGFAVRPLDGERDVDAYVELHRSTFDSKNMTPEWRRRTFHAAHHRPETDLVAVAPDGRLAGFCIGWLTDGRLPVGQIEPMGIGLEFREHGLGAALLTECVRRLLASGARELYVETDTYRTPALGLYESLGFSPLRDVLVYRKDFGTGD
jgi:mycothiol synthase